MNTSLLDRVVNTVLYEGYRLYPYRPAARKNQRERFTFGRVYPPACPEAQSGVERCFLQAECLLHRPGPAPVCRITVGFLHPMGCDVGVLPAPLDRWPKGTELEFKIVPELSVGDQRYPARQEAVERRIKIPPLTLNWSVPHQMTLPFSLPASYEVEPILDDVGAVQGVTVRRQRSLAGVVVLDVEPVEARCVKITVRVLNETALRSDEAADTDAVLMSTFAATHLVFRADQCEFISLTDPPPEYQSLAESCYNLGVWPVLVGDETKGERHTLLASPIILPDYPQIAPDSAGDFDEETDMLSLGVLTPAEEEKQKTRADDFDRRMPRKNDFLKTHGTIRDAAWPAIWNRTAPVRSGCVDGVKLRTGDRIRVRPKKHAAAPDPGLAGKTAVIEAAMKEVVS